MKSYNHLWEQYLSDENYYFAVHNATLHKGGKKKKYQKAQYFKRHVEELKDEILEYAENFYNDDHTPQEINDGIRHKKRIILVPTMREQVVHHMIINVLKPIIMKPMYYHSYGSVPDRGATKGRKRKSLTKGGKESIEKYIRHHPQDCRYCLKMDVKKFFDSVPHDKLKARLAKIIHDKRFLNLLYTVIDANGADVGIPIGFYTSQWFANFYLTPLDHYIKEVLGVKGYFRYMDDMVIFGSNKRELHEIRKKILWYLNEILGLDMNHKWQLFRFHYVKKSGKEVGRQLDFMGFQFFRNRTILRRPLMLRVTRKARRIRKKGINRTAYDCRQMLSYNGWLTPTNTYNMYKVRIKPYVSFRRLRQIVGNAQRKENKSKREAAVCGTEMKTAVM